MSKRALKKYVGEVPKKELEAQIIDLYERFPAVKKYYDFIFNPNEERLVDEAKAKIRNEYFPTRRKRPRARRSIAQKYIAHFRKLQMDPSWVTELMLFNLETALAFEARHRVPEAFYKSMLNSYVEVIQFLSINSLFAQYQPRVQAIYQKVLERKWINQDSFSREMELFGDSSREGE